MVSAYRSSVVARRGGAYRPLTALQSPYCQRRLLRTSPCRMPIALPRESVIAKAPALSQGTTAVSCWLAPYGASSVPCSGIRPVVPKGHCLRGNRRRRVVREGTPPFTFGSRSVPWKPYPAPRFTAAASCISAASRASALSRLASATPRTGLAPTHHSTGPARKAAQAGEFKRWGAESMRHFASSHIQPFSPSPMRLVLPLRKVSALPSLPHARRFASACASCWRPRRGAPLEASAQVRASRGQTSACVVGRGAIASVGRPLLLSRLARVTQIRRVPSSAHRGRRIASADSCATRVACDGRAFASRIRIAHSALALAPVVPASPVNRSAPTHRSRGRCAMKPRSAPELKRWA